MGFVLETKNISEDIRIWLISIRENNFIRVCILSLILCACTAFSYSAEAERLGRNNIQDMQYPNSELIDRGYCIYGSSNIQTKGYLFWTEDSVDSVLEHFEQHFPDFLLRNSDDVGKWWFSAKRLEEGVVSDIPTFGFYITIIDGQQEYRSIGMLPRGYYDDEFKQSFGSLPYYGTIIIIEHDIYSL
jgi:hypothetical protein